jgi:hypothetical protein
MEKEYAMVSGRMMVAYGELKENKKKWGSGNVVTRESRKVYNRCNKDLQRFLREKENAYWLSIASELMQFHGRKDSRGFHQHVKEATGQGSQGDSCNRMRKADGTVAFSKPEILLCWQEHFSGLLNVNEETSNIDDSVLDEMQQRNVDGDLGALMTEAEVKTAISSMKNCKAPGPDGIPAEFLKLYLDSPKALGGLTRMCQQVWRRKKVYQRAGKQRLLW